MYKKICFTAVFLCLFAAMPFVSTLSAANFNDSQLIAKGGHHGGGHHGGGHHGGGHHGHHGHGGHGHHGHGHHHGGWGGYGGWGGWGGYGVGLGLGLGVPTYYYNSGYSGYPSSTYYYDNTTPYYYSTPDSGTSIYLDSGN